MSEHQMEYPFHKTWWVNDGQILAGGYPGHKDPDLHHDMVQALLGCKITHFINLQEADEKVHGKPFNPYLPVAQGIARRQGMELGFDRFPIVDQQVPDIELLAACLDKIDQVLTDNGKPYVHCWGGNGRTGTVIGCWLIRHGRTPEQALEEMADGREGRHCRHAAPENLWQRAFVMDWTQHDPAL